MDFKIGQSIVYYSQENSDYVEGVIEDIVETPKDFVITALLPDGRYQFILPKVGTPDEETYH